MHAPQQAYVKVHMETSQLVSMGMLKINDPHSLHLHRQIASPIVKAGHCECDPAFMPLVNAEEHTTKCIYYYNKRRCFCHHCTGLSGTPLYCNYGARNGYFPHLADEEDEERQKTAAEKTICSRSHCWMMNPKYSRKVCMNREPPSDAWMCARCQAVFLSKPIPGHPRVEELSDDEATKRKKILEKRQAVENYFKRKRKMQANNV
jgi:hypothetical protein